MSETAAGSPADVARAYLASFADRDPDAIVSRVAPGFVNVHASALGDGSTGRDEYRRRLPPFLDAFPGLRYDVQEVISEGTAVAARYRLKAIVDGHRVDLPGVMIFEVVDGLIVRRTDHWDSLSFLRQTGHAG